MKKNLVYNTIFIALLFSIFFLGNIASAWSYPLRTLTISNCGDSVCNIDLPKITNASYSKYKGKYAYKLVYSVLRLSTYYGRRDIGAGSHQGVDFACATGTPVYATYDGTVIVAGKKGDRGNVIVIEHERNGKKYFSVYAHLSEIDVNVGDFVTEGLKIGEVGETGNATGPHLHFQIDTNQDGKHPYFPSGCNGTIREIVNNGLCSQDIRRNTVDPIVFLEETTKLANTISEKTKTPFYVSSDEIQLSGFVGGFLETNSVVQLSVSKTSTGGSIISKPITVDVNSGYVTATPNEIQVLAGERNIYFQSKNKTGIVTATINYGDTKLISIPMLIGTSGDIASRRGNKTLMSTLKSIGIK